jgi:hypothetical protein
MRRLVRRSILVCTVLLLPAAAQAQGRADFAVGYSALHLFGTNGIPGVNFAAGYFLSGGPRVGRGVMLVADVAYSTKSLSGFGVTATGSVLTFAGGFRITGSSDRRGPREPVRPFVEVLVGGARLSASLGGEPLVAGNALAIAPGAGVDIPVGRRTAVRLAGKFELYHSGGNAHAFRFDVGVAFGAGRR